MQNYVCRDHKSKNCLKLILYIYIKLSLKTNYLHHAFFTTYIIRKTFITHQLEFSLAEYLKILNIKVRTFVALSNRLLTF